MATTTWVEPPPTDVADPSLTGAFVRGARSLGRTTVLPRVGTDSGRPTLVDPREARFEQGEELGRGGVGIVNQFTDRDIGRSVAIKHIHRALQSDRARLRFAEHVRTIGGLDHPNILTIHDVGTDDIGQPYFIMKYLSGKTMADVLSELRKGDETAHARWTISKRMAVFRKVLEAVAYAHEHGVVHRDLKPDHIMLGDNDEVTVIDWAIAHRASSTDFGNLNGKDPIEERITHTQTGSILGTPAYMAPEQARGEPATASSDIYSLGVTLYEWLTLTHFLGGYEELDELLNAVSTVEPTLPALVQAPHQTRIPAELSWMVMAAIEKSPSERIASANDWLQRLDAMDQGDIPIQCPATFQKHWLSKLGQQVDQNPNQVLAAGGAVVLAFSGLLITGMAATFALGSIFF